ncbi:MAG TPA: FAD-binding oxidoreductase, partial [Psychrobacter sp.]|nr:FAD-binding oxidoreductase [Psychrobacter sp.]
MTASNISNTASTAHELAHSSDQSPVDAPELSKDQTTDPEALTTLLTSLTST